MGTRLRHILASPPSSRVTRSGEVQPRQHLDRFARVCCGAAQLEYRRPRHALIPGGLRGLGADANDPVRGVLGGCRGEGDPIAAVGL